MKKYKGQMVVKSKEDTYFWDVQKGNRLSHTVTRYDSATYITIYNNSNIETVSIHLPNKRYVELNANTGEILKNEVSS